MGIFGKVTSLIKKFIYDENLKIVTAKGEYGNETYYKVGKTLGHGGGGVVYKAVDLKTGKKVALKLTPRNNLDMCKGELENLKTLKHPNIVKVIDLGENDTDVYVVMELMEKGDLLEKCLEGCSEKKARGYFRQLVETLVYIHRKKVCHRDIKPQNILLDNKGNIKVCDFGLSSGQHTATTADGLLQTPCGTRKYKAPEIISNKMYDGVKFDVWSAGVVLYQLVAGEFPPFVPPSEFNMKLFNDNKIPYPDRFSPELRELLNAMLKFDPSERIDSSQIKGYAWYQGVKHESLALSHKRQPRSTICQMFKNIMCR